MEPAVLPRRVVLHQHTAATAAAQQCWQTGRGSRLTNIFCSSSCVGCRRGALVVVAIMIRWVVPVVG